MLTILYALAAFAAEPQAAAVEKEDPVVCKRTLRGSTGSRLRSSRVCLRQSQWDEEQRQADRIAQKINDRGGTSGPRPEGTGLSPGN